MREQVPDSETETYEHIPWSRLTLTNETDGRGRWMYLAAGLLIAAAVAAIVARIAWQPEVTVATQSTSSNLPAPIVDVPESAPVPALYSEADLMAAVPPIDIGRRVASVAERYVRQWAGSSAEPWSYVEWTAVESVDDLGEGLFRIGLLMQLLVGGEAGTVRLPVEAVEVSVLVDGGAISVVDLPSPAEVESLSVDRPIIEPASPPPVVAQSALDAAARWGTGTIVGGGSVGDRWRVEIEIEGVDGPARTVAVWVTSDGSPADPVP